MSLSPGCTAQHSSCAQCKCIVVGRSEEDMVDMAMELFTVLSCAPLQHVASCALCCLPSFEFHVKIEPRPQLQPA
eukprot:3470167-Amphidinium_carterae.1